MSVSRYKIYLEKYVIIKIMKVCGGKRWGGSYRFKRNYLGIDYWIMYCIWGKVVFK